MMFSNKKRITVLLGAGAVIDPTKIGTDYITKSLLNETSDECKNILKLFHDDFEKKAIISSKEEKERGYEHLDLNFEDYYHLLDIVNGYSEYKAVKDRMNKYQIISKRLEHYKEFSQYDYILAKSEMADKINEIVYSYDKNFEKNGVFIKEFLGILKERYKLDIFNLNYDTLCEQTLKNYNDGFENSKYRSPFNVKKYFDNSKDNTISHLHGCINYGYIYDPSGKHKNQEFYSKEDTSLYKFNKYEDNDIKYPRELPTQSGENCSYGNIITGLLKTEKIMQQPFLSYFNYFYHALLNNDILIIVGYGYGDIYINNCINMYLKLQNKKLIFIDYIHSDRLCDSEGHAKCTYAKEHLSSSNKKEIYKDFWYEFDNIRYINDYYENEKKLIFTCGMSTTLYKYKNYLNKKLY